MRKRIIGIFLFLNLICSVSLFAQPCPDIIGVDTLRQQLNDCNGIASVCVPVPLASFGQYSVRLNGADYQDAIAACNVVTVYYYSTNSFTSGNAPFVLNKWTVNGVDYTVSFSTIAELVAKMVEWDPNGNWVYNVAADRIEGGNSRSNYSALEVWYSVPNTTQTIAYQSTPTANGIAFNIPFGDNLLTFINKNDGCRDSVRILVSCVQTTVIRDTLWPGEMISHTLETGELLGKVISTRLTSSGGPVATYRLAARNTELEITAVSPGTAQTEVILCDDQGTCDTTVYITQVKQPLPARIVRDTIFPEEVKDVSLTLDHLNSPIETIENICTSKSGKWANFYIDQVNKIVTYTGLQGTGLSEACILSTAANGRTDTTYFKILVLRNAGQIVTDSVSVGASKEICVSTDRLVGTITYPGVAYDIEGNLYSIAMSNTSACFTVTGIEPGEDVFYVVFKDEFRADTTTIRLTVVDQSESPVANDDEVTASRETPTDIRILDNDVIPRNYIRSLNLLDGTLLIGTIEILPDNSLEFIPSNDTCGITDTVQYVVCNNTGCDTANVSITLPCAAKPTLVYNGFSPNGDGINDKFVIGGMAEGEKVQLQVFDRWGNRVYLSTQYANDWEGTFDNKILPDGTYYWYLVRENGEVDGGYVELRR